jgi:hypothetical protein
MAELKSLAKERGLRGYFTKNKKDLIELIRSNAYVSGAKPRTSRPKTRRRISNPLPKRRGSRVIPPKTRRSL